jgi:hypothetical protein
VTSSVTLDEWVDSLLTLAGVSGNISTSLSLHATGSFNADKGDRSEWSGGHEGLDSFTATSSGHSATTLTSDGVYGGAGSFTLTGGAWGSMSSEEVGSWSMTSTGGFTHTRDWQGTQTITKEGTYGSSGGASFTSYQSDSLSTQTTWDTAWGALVLGMSYSQQNISGSGTTGTLSSTYASGSIGSNGIEWTLQPSTSTVTLSFPVDSLRWPGPVAVGQLAVTEPPREGPALYGVDVKVPLAAPLWVSSDPPELLRGTEGWWLQVRGAAMGEPSQALTIQVSQPTPPEVPPGTPEGSSGPGLPGLWSWLGQEATDGYVAQGPGMHACAWSVWVDAAPSSDPFMTALRNPPLLVKASNPWDSNDLLTTFDQAMMSRIKRQAQGQETLPLFSGSLPIYGAGGNQTPAGAMVQAGEMIVGMMKPVLQAFQFTPLAPVATAVLAAERLAVGDYVSVAIDVAGLVGFTALGAAGKALEVSDWPLGARVAIKFTAGGYWARRWAPRISTTPSPGVSSRGSTRPRTCSPG